MKIIGYNDYLTKLYGDQDLKKIITRTISFQITDGCMLNCSYCYQINKTHKIMNKETAKKAVDLLFKMYDEDTNDFINKDIIGLTFDFIGGEPLINIDIIDYICSYFLDQCLEKNHPWLYTWRISLITNGVLYFDPKVQNFLKKFCDFLSFTVTLDGPKELHDACRTFPNGEGSFEKAYAAIKHFNENYYEMSGTKVTIAPDNLKNLNKIINFFIEEGFSNIAANPINEVFWTVDQSKQYYKELKIMADYLLELNSDVSVTLFDPTIGRFLDPLRENDNWCGGNMSMLAFDPDGIAYPCIRYMKSSLGDTVPPIIIGDVDGLFKTNEQKEKAKELSSMTRCSQSTEECINCPIAKGCSWCSAWNYQQFGQLNKRSMNLCYMHKARVLANVYYWNLYYQKNNIDKKFKLNLPEKDALEIISKEEYDFLVKLSQEN